MNEKEKEKIWEEMVERSNKRIWDVEWRKEEVVWRKEKVGWKKELVSDLKLFMILLVFWISFVSIIEILGL